MKNTSVYDLLKQATKKEGTTKFQITGTMDQLEFIKNDLRDEWIKSGLFIVMDAGTLPTTPFSTVSFEGIEATFTEGLYFSIKEIPTT